MLHRALLNCFEYSAETIRMQVAVVGHAESLFQPFDNSHSINWLLGHIVSARTTPLSLLGAENVWSDARRARYRHGSSPIGYQDESVLQFDELVRLFNETQCWLQASLQSIDDAALLRPSGYGKNSVFDSLLYFHFHESYHVGQMTMIAEALGKPAAYLTSSTS
ncbi:MAG: DinB family protein [Chloroflexi bacterium]|nr:DinB family protein [Chloroflexota bacterium]